MKCSSTIVSYDFTCSNEAPVTDVASCKSFCGSSKYFTWKGSECFCKHSDSGRREASGSISGRTKCTGQYFCGMDFPVNTHSGVKFILFKFQAIMKNWMSGIKGGTIRIERWTGSGVTTMSPVCSTASPTVSSPTRSETTS